MRRPVWPRLALPGLACTLAAGLAAVVAGCYDRNDFSPSEPLLRSILSLESESGAASLPADGVSRLHLVVRVSTDTGLDRRAVLVTTSEGTLLGGTPEGEAQRLDPDAGGRARVDLVSPTRPGAAEVTARLAAEPGIAASLTVDFGPSLPDALRLRASPSRLVAGEEVEVEVTASLSRGGGAGSVTPGAEVSFSASASGSEVGVFSSAVVAAGADGTAGTTLFVHPEKAGEILLTAITEGTDGPLVARLVVVVIAGDTLAQLVGSSAPCLSRAAKARRAIGTESS